MHASATAGAGAPLRTARPGLAHGGSAESLLQQADAAMYRAKRLRSGYEFYGPGN